MFKFFLQRLNRKDVNQNTIDEHILWDLDKDIEHYIIEKTHQPEGENYQDIGWKCKFWCFFQKDWKRVMETKILRIIILYET